MDEHKGVMSEFAIASLVIGIASFINLAGMEKAIAAIVFGALALKRIRKDNQLSGKNLAQAGIILGILVSIIILKVINIEPVIAWWSVLLACVVSIGVGIISGVYPAIRAGRLDPVEALRYE